MKKFPVQLFLTFGLILNILAKPHGFDDEGEISVPRSPKIEGPSVVTLILPNKNVTTEEGNLQCHIEGSPTPTVIWLKDGQEIRSDEDPSYTTIFDVREGTAKLNFKDSAYKDKKSRTGNFTCMAANFLGQVQKLFIVTVDEGDISNTSAISHPVPVDGSNTIPDEVGTRTSILPNNSVSEEQTSTSNKEDFVTYMDKDDATSTTSVENADLVLTSPSMSSSNSFDVTSTDATASKR